LFDTPLMQHLTLDVRHLLTTTLVAKQNIKFIKFHLKVRLD